MWKFLARDPEDSFIGISQIIHRLSFYNYDLKVSELSYFTKKTFSMKPTTWLQLVPAVVSFILYLIPRRLAMMNAVH